MRHPSLFTVLSVFALIASGCGRKPAPVEILPDVMKNHLQRNHIFGKVKSVESQTFYLHNDSIPVSDTSDIANLIQGLAPDSYSNQQYSSDGYLTDYVKLDESLDTLLVRHYKYHPDALLESWEEFSGSGKRLTNGEYSYDRNRFLESERIFKDDSLVMLFKYTTDGIGNITSSTQTFGNVSTRTETRYNESGQPVQIVEYEPDGKVFKTAKIEYDNYGDEVNRCVYKSGNQMIEYTYNKYDQAGRQIQTIYEDRIHDVREYRYYFSYDKHKNWKYEVCCVDGLIVYVRSRHINYYEF